MFYVGNNIVVSNHFAQPLTENVRFRFSASMQSNVTALDECFQLLRKQDALEVIILQKPLTTEVEESLK